MDRDEQGAMAGDSLQQADRLRDLRMWDAAILAYRAHLASIENMQPKFFHKLAEFGDDLRLKPDVQPQTAGQHRNKA